MSTGERKGEDQKLKMLVLARIFLTETDDEHALTMKQIIRMLADRGVNADRKTLYLDFEELRRYGMDIMLEKSGRESYYHLGSRDFELPELKLLVDSVQSARFLTDGKSKELIKKLESLTSRHQAKQLQRQVKIPGRVKTMNESIYYNVDALHSAINADRMIRFRYCQWNLKKRLEYRRGGDWYVVSPWALVLDNENYYMVGYDAAEDRIKHYRVDKMKEISATEDRREGRDQFRSFDLPRYANSLFGMFGGEERPVTIEADNSKVGILIDRFGKGIRISRVGENSFRTTVNVAVSDQFLAWIIGLGEGVRLVGPDDVVGRMRAVAERLYEEYGAPF